LDSLSQLVWYTEHVIVNCLDCKQLGPTNSSKKSLNKRLVYSNVFYILIISINLSFSSLSSVIIYKWLIFFMSFSSVQLSSSTV